jgi:hypothetical protein
MLHRIKLFTRSKYEMKCMHDWWLYEWDSLRHIPLNIRLIGRAIAFFHVFYHENVVEFLGNISIYNRSAAGECNVRCDDMKHGWKESGFGCWYNLDLPTIFIPILFPRDEICTKLPVAPRAITETLCFLDNSVNFCQLLWGMLYSKKVIRLRDDFVTEYVWSFLWL